MQTFALFLRTAEIEDAFIYRSTLYCWTFGHRLRAYPIPQIEKELVRSVGDEAQSPTYHMFHSGGFGATLEQRLMVSVIRDSMDEPTPHGLASVTPAGSDETLRRIDRSNRRRRARKEPESTVELTTHSDTLELSAEDIPYIEFGVAMDATAVNDMMMYYDKLFLSADSGLFQLDIFDPDQRRPQNNPIRAGHRTNGPCFTAAAGLGAVAASCGDNGLYILFDVINDNEHELDAKRVSDLSVRSEIGWGAVVNHRSGEELEFLSGTISRTGKRPHLSAVETVAITGREGLIANVASPQDYRSNFTLWDRGRLATFLGGQALSLSVTKNADGTRAIRHANTIAHYNTLAPIVVSVARAGSCFAMETPENLIIASKASLIAVDTGPIISMRTFPRSRRYTRLIMATTADGLWLIATGYGSSRECPEDEEW
jgi:hypothetical protein